MLTRIETLEQLNQEIDMYHYVVLDCSGTFCGPCRMIAPRVAALAQQESAVRFLECNEKATDLMETFNISTVPTFLFFRNGMFLPELTVKGAYLDLITSAVQLLQKEKTNQP